MRESVTDITFPLPLTAYASSPGDSLLSVLRARIEADPFNAVATTIFLLAVIHTFFAARFITAAHRVQQRRDAENEAAGLSKRPSVAAELLHFLGEVEVIFALWGIPLVIAIVLSHDFATAQRYLNDTVNYTEPMFVVIIMALASTRPIIELAEGALRRLANLGGATPGAWWFVILTIGPLLGSFITEPAAMTISALLLARQFFVAEAGRGAEVRHARSALREHIDRRHADALRRAADPDGRATLGVGYGIRPRTLRMACRAGHRVSRRLATTSCFVASSKHSARLRRCHE